MSQAVTTIEENSSSLMSLIDRATRDPEFDLNKFQALLAMKRELDHEFAKRAFNQAMAAAQTEMMPVIRDAANTHTQSKYARLETIDAQMRPIYTKHGFAVRYGSAPAPRDGWIRVICTVSHTDGYSEENYLDAPPDIAGSQGKSNKTPIQAVGSSVTYLRRYLLTMCFNIVLADEDDDGSRVTRPANGAGNGAHQQQRGAVDPFPTLSEPHGPTWVKNLMTLLDEAPTLAVKIAITDDPRVQRVIRTAPRDVVANIREMLRAAHQRLENAAAERLHRTEAQVNGTTTTTNEGGDTQWPDETAELIAEVQAMDLPTVETISHNNAWIIKTRDLFPLDQDRINEAIVERTAYLRSRDQQPPP
jgi:hypothetical protein